MKIISLATTAALIFSFQALALDYTCKSYSLKSQNPMSNPTTMNFSLDLAGRSVEVTSPDLGFSEIGDLEELRGASEAYKLSFGVGVDQVQFMISEDSNYDVLTEYVISLGQNYSLSSRELEQIEAKLERTFSGVNINGTQLILAEVKELMSCRRL